MFEIIQGVILIGLLYLLWRWYQQSQQKYLLLVILSGILVIILKTSLHYMAIPTLTLVFAVLTLVICLISGWLIIKNQK